MSSENKVVPIKKSISPNDLKRLNALGSTLNQIKAAAAGTQLEAALLLEMFDHKYEILENERIDPITGEINVVAPKGSPSKP